MKAGSCVLHRRSSEYYSPPHSSIFPFTVSSNSSNSTTLLTKRRFVCRPRLKTLLKLSSATVLMLIAGCTSTPTPTEINQQIDHAVQALEQAYQQRRAECNGNSACEESVRLWYQQMYADLQAARLAALQENWQDAYERRRLWEDEIRSWLPGWPEIKDFFPVQRTSVLNSTISTSSLGSILNQSFTSTWIKNARLSGTFSISNTNFDASAEIRGSLSMSGTSLINGGVEATIYSGSISADLLGSSDTTATLAIAPAILGVPGSSQSKLVLDASGTGHVNLVLVPTIPNVAWNAIIPRHIRVKLPVTLDSQGKLHLDLSNARLGDVMPNDWHFASDFNRDGVLDHGPDLAAFLIGMQNQDIRTDVNCDNQIDQSDLQVWEQEYADDLNP
jgi:hypothetical protein